LAALAPRTGTLNAGAATAGIVHIEMKITGQKTGVFKGDITAKGHEDEINVLDYQFSVTSPRDPATGLPTGRRQFQPVMITKQLNSSSPEILNALDTNENLTSVVINFFQTTKTGAEVNFYRVKLTDATISADKQSSSGSTVVEQVSFTFRRIEQDSITGKTSVIADWQQNLR
jgi:type VI secretion system secreted protein Hcp